jgi:hypothetical protein
VGGPDRRRQRHPWRLAGTLGRKSFAFLLAFARPRRACGCAPRAIRRCAARRSVSTANESNGRHS